MVWPSHHRLAQNKYDLEKINVEWLMPKKITTSASDPANFVHQLPQKESGGKLYGSRSRQLSHQLPQKESGRKLYDSRSRQLSHQLPQKESG